MIGSVPACDVRIALTPGGGGVLLVWATYLCTAPKGMVFVAILVRNLVSNKVWFMHSVLN